MREYRGGTMYKLTGQTFVALLQLTFNDHKVWWAAPIVKHLERFEKEKLLKYCDSKGWTLEVMKP